MAAWTAEAIERTSIPGFNHYQSQSVNENTQLTQHVESIKSTFHVLTEVIVGFCGGRERQTDE